MKLVYYQNGVPRVSWTEEVKNMNVIKELQLALIKMMSKRQCKIKKAIVKQDTHAHADFDEVQFDGQFSPHDVQKCVLYHNE